MEIICSCLTYPLNVNESNNLDVGPRALQHCSEMSKIEQVYKNQNKSCDTIKQRCKHCVHRNYHKPRSHLPITDLRTHWSSIKSSIILNDGTKSPVYGFGVHGAKPGTETVQAVHWALQEGYRLIDTASRYNNEESVGEAIRTSGIPREDIFVITKLYDDDHGYDETMAAFGKSLSRLGLEYVDMYLIHAPVPDKVVPSWKAMVELKKQGLISALHEVSLHSGSWGPGDWALKRPSPPQEPLHRLHEVYKLRSIGVSNFGVHHLEELRKHTDVLPSVNQIELHPFLQEAEVVRYCQCYGIVLQAYSPITRGEKLENPVLTEIAKALQRTPAQILLRWSIQNGYIALPKSSKSKRIRENANVFDFEIPANTMEKLNGLEQGFRTGKNKIEKPWFG